jgi:hypothetical protein
MRNLRSRVVAAALLSFVAIAVLLPACSSSKAPESKGNTSQTSVAPPHNAAYVVGQTCFKNDEAAYNSAGFSCRMNAGSPSRVKSCYLLKKPLVTRPPPPCSITRP